MSKNADIALGVQDQDAQVARDNQRIGLAGLSNIYSGASGRQIDALNTAETASRDTNNAAMGWAGLGLGIASSGKLGKFTGLGNQ